MERKKPFTSQTFTHQPCIKTGLEKRSGRLSHDVLYHPHSITGRTPNALCFGRTIRPKIPSISELGRTYLDDGEIRDRDAQKKLQGKEREDRRRRSRNVDIVVGDTVLMQNLHPTNKLSTTFEQERFSVTNRSGSRVTIQSKECKKFERNVALVKKIPNDEIHLDLNGTTDSTNIHTNTVPMDILDEETEREVYTPDASPVPFNNTHSDEDITIQPDPTSLGVPEIQQPLPSTVGDSTIQGQSSNTARRSTIVTRRPCKLNDFVVRRKT